MTLISHDICHILLQLYTQTIPVFLYNYTQTKQAHVKSLSIKIKFEKLNIYTQIYEYNTIV